MLLYAVCFSWYLCLSGCQIRTQSPANTQPFTLTLMASGGDAIEVDYNNRELSKFQQDHNVVIRNLNGYDTVDQRLDLFRQLFRRKSPQPDICKIDSIWVGALAGDLIDLRPYLSTELGQMDPGFVNAFMFRGQLLAIPMVMDTPVLYYRTDLIRRYGYRHPPRTWDELTRMALVIQNGERRRGNRGFWGFAWHGAEGEGLTCTALEWQMAEGGGNLIEDDRTVNVDNPRFRTALERASGWVGTISPPSIVEYDEEDAKNLWLDGNAAFLRSWSDVYQVSREPSSAVRGRFDAAPLPSGRMSRNWVFGGMALGVSRYSRHMAEAIEAVRFMVSSEAERKRVLTLGLIPTRTSLLADRSLLEATALHGALGQNWQAGTCWRPSRILGDKYREVSQQYSSTVHQVLKHRISAADALRHLQKELVSISGFPEARR